VVYASNARFLCFLYEISANLIPAIKIHRADEKICYLIIVDADATYFKGREQEKSSN
jgi:hypothetical protein